MKLKRFKASGIHGFLRFDIRFNRELTFLTGINGSGKTTAINALVALISPDLSILANLQYDELSVTIEHDKSNITISARTDDYFVYLSLTGVEEQFVYQKYVTDPELPLSRQQDAEVEHYREVLASQSGHAILRLIASLPTPMFLGLDRRARYEDDFRRNRFPIRGMKSGRNIFGSSLSRSLADASELAENKFRDALIASGRIAETLQRDMLLSLITVDRSEQPDFSSLSIPSDADRREIERVRRDLDTLSQILNLPKPEVRKRVGPLLDLLETLSKRIPTNASIDELLKTDSRRSEVLDSIFQWTNNLTHLQRIKVISETVSRYTKQRFELIQPTEKYLQLVNKFLNDSGKSIAFGDRGYIYMTLDNDPTERSITYLSSGEAQIFVILTHLAFHPLAQKDNVFIIDEPELSLHIHWQELFVDSIQSANPNIQYVLATHSPSIILDRIDDCVDISRKRASAGRGRRH